jgi:phosphoribosylamine--glycine ligase
MAPLAHPLEIAPTDIEALSGWAASRSIDLAVIGPEAPLAAGLADRFRKKGVPAFGPLAAAARIESSKAFAKALMEKAGVPTAAHRSFGDLAEAEAYLAEVGAPVVVKASGLAAGKGVVVAGTEAEARDALRLMMSERVFGESGREVVIEAFMEGEEISLFGVCDGEDVLLLLPSQDHKRIGEGDQGPNTGGMGAYAPVSIATPERMEEARTSIFLPTLAALAEEGTPFRGLLYAGLMLTDRGLEVVEFNCRFGDPETQVVLPLLDSSLLDLLATVAEGGSVAGTRLRWREGAAVTTVIASQGYPGEYPKGRELRIPPGLEREESTLLFHAGTARQDGRLIATGGRVLSATGLGATLEEAAERSRAAAGAIELEGKQFRRDIGWRELERAAR